MEQRKSKLSEGKSFCRSSLLKEACDLTKGKGGHEIQRTQVYAVVLWPKAIVLWICSEAGSSRQAKQK